MTSFQLALGIVVAIAVAVLFSFLAVKAARSIGGDTSMVVRWGLRAFFPGLPVGFLIVYSNCKPGPATADSLVVEPTPVVQGERLYLKVNGLKYDDTPRVVLDHVPPSVTFALIPAERIGDRDLMPIGSMILGEVRDPDSGWSIELKNNQLPAGKQTLAGVINFLGRQTRVMTTVEVKPRVASENGSADK